MKQLYNFFFFISLLHFSLAVNGQWIPSSTGFSSGVTHCFIESSGVLLAGGNGSGIYSSADNGNTWIPSNTGIVAGSEILCFGKNSAGIFAGADSIYFSSNNGTSWNIVNNSKNVFAFAFLTDTVFAASIGSGVIMSANNGSTWISTNTGLPNDSVYSILAKGNLLFAGTLNGVYISSNSGASWTAANTGLPSSVIIRCLETDGTNVYAGTTGWFNPSNGMFISSNNGASWTQVTNGISTTGYVMGITSIGNAMLAGAAMAGVYRSLDNGASWNSFNAGLPPVGSFGAGNFYETTQYVFCGFEGGSQTIYRINKNEVISGIVPDENYSFFSIYPNPANQIATIKFDNPKNENCTLTIYDRKGMLVRSITNIMTGIVEIERQNLSCGLYFFQLRSDRQILANGKLTLE